MYMRVDEVGKLAHEIRKDTLRIFVGKVVRELEEEIEEKYDFSEKDIKAYREGLKFAKELIKEMGAAE